MAKTRTEISRAYALRHPERMREIRKRSRAKRREAIREEQRSWQSKNRVRLNQRRREQYAANIDVRREKVRVYLKQRTPKQRARDNERKKAWYEKNRERINAKNRSYAAAHKEDINAHRRKKFATDLHFRFSVNLRNRIIKILSGANKSASTTALLGCSIADFKIYLESRFEPGMTWENYGEVWEIDHIVPCAIFDLSNPEHQRRCCHFSNLQPMFWLENRKKGRRLIINETKGERWT